MQASAHQAQSYIEKKKWPAAELYMGIKNRMFINGKNVGR
jgi:hypothetical protein